MTPAYTQSPHLDWRSRLCPVCSDTLLCPLSFSASVALFHLQVLCGQALKQRLGCLRRPLVASLGFSASPLHIPQTSQAICTTHTPAKASCNLTLSHRITLSHSLKEILQWHSSVSLSCCWSLQILWRNTFIFLWCCFFSWALCVSRLKLHNIQCVLQHPFSTGHHHNRSHSGSTG